MYSCGYSVTRPPFCSAARPQCTRQHRPSPPRPPRHHGRALLQVDRVPVPVWAVCGAGGRDRGRALRAAREPVEAVQCGLRAPGRRCRRNPALLRLRRRGLQLPRRRDAPDGRRARAVWGREQRAAGDDGGDAPLRVHGVSASTYFVFCTAPPREHGATPPPLPASAAVLTASALCWEPCILYSGAPLQDRPCMGVAMQTAGRRSGSPAASSQRCLCASCDATPTRRDCN